MKKYIFYVVILIQLNTSFVFGQISTANYNREEVEKIPQEKIYLHYNSSFLMSGDYLLFTMYCFDTKTFNLSQLSKVGYIELVNSNKKSVFKTKLKLNNGIGYGDFFIPTSLPSGDYKIIAYTQWMRNGSLENFFRNDISIINPFQKEQTAILQKENSKNSDTLNTKHVINNTTKFSTLENANLEILFNDTIFASRKKVSIDFKSKVDDFILGNYSVSVRKLDELKIPNKLDAVNFNFINKSTFKAEKNFFLPELRGELLIGKIYKKNTKTVAKNVKIGLSIPGKNYIFKIASSNDNGIFYFNIDILYESENAILQIIGKDRDNYSLELTPDIPIAYNDLTFFNFKINKNAKETILKHSIYNQIENNYASAKPNVQKKLAPLTPFFSADAKTYYLDDYTRFPTVQETIIEIINEVYVRQHNKEKELFTRVYKEEGNSELQPLVLIDGILVQNQNNFINSKASRIKSISVVNKLYSYGAQLFEGIISFETFNGDYSVSITDAVIKKITLFKPQFPKDYFVQKYNSDTDYSRIPDYRSQLYWNPKFTLTAENKNISFFTSNNKGIYEFCLEGFTKTGKPITVKKQFLVN